MRSSRTESVARFAALNALWISLTVQDTALLAIAVPSAIVALDPAHHVAALALLISVSNVAAMLVPPLAGWFSDRRRRGGGTRRPWIIVGVAVDVCALVALAYAHSVLTFDLLFILAVAAENVAIAAYQAMIPEVVPRAAWGAASGYRGAATLVGTVAGFAIAGTILNLPIVYFTTAGLLVLASLTLFGLHERPWSEPERAAVTRWHDFIVVFVARSFVFFGLALLMTFVLYFFRDVLHVGNPSAGTAAVGIFSLLGAIVSSVVLGVLSDRVPRKYVVSASGVPMAIAAIGFAIAPEPSVIFACAGLFGIGVGGILSAGWALAIDSLPQLRDVARDLGIWGIATNLPNVVAPIAGGWILWALGGTRFGYQVIFAIAGLSFLLGALTVLRAGVTPLSSLAGMPVWIAAILCVDAYTGVVHRVRGWGRMSRSRGPSLVVINHQHPIDATTIVSRLGVQSSWRHPIFTSTGRRMWEPGFFVVEFPWLSGLMRNVSAGPLFSTLGFMPIENQLYARPVASLALDVERVHGPLAVADVFAGDVASRFPPGTMTNDLRSAANFQAAQAMIPMRDLREPYRAGVLHVTRERTRGDVAAIEQKVRRGGTFFLTPEGTYSTNGELRPMRGLLRRLVPLARSVYALGVSYDAFRGRRLSMLYRIVEVRDRTRVAEELAAARPVTVTQLLASWLVDRDAPFAGDEAVAAVRAALERVPAALFADPELRRNPTRVTRAALATMVARGMLSERSGSYVVASRKDPRFALVEDAIAYHARFYAQSVAATRSSTSP